MTAVAVRQVIRRIHRRAQRKNSGNPARLPDAPTGGRPARSSTRRRVGTGA